ncbi:MAG TPA: hypothetical protein VJ742_12550 [Nitrososphaera sp.]|nr:hypothetical protein [Nitrososphaera sp.]
MLKELQEARAGFWCDGPQVEGPSIRCRVEDGVRVLAIELEYVARFNGDTHRVRRVAVLGLSPCVSWVDVVVKPGFDGAQVNAIGREVCITSIAMPVNADIAECCESEIYLGELTLDP